MNGWQWWSKQKLRWPSCYSEVVFEPWLLNKAWETKTSPHDQQQLCKQPSALPGKCRWEVWCLGLGSTHTMVKCWVKIGLRESLFHHLPTTMTIYVHWMSLRPRHFGILLEWSFINMDNKLLMCLHQMSDAEIVENFLKKDENDYAGSNYRNKPYDSSWKLEKVRRFFPPFYCKHWWDESVPLLKMHFWQLLLRI